MMTITELINDCGFSYEKIATLYGLDIETLIRYKSRLKYPTIEEVNKILTESSTFHDDNSNYKSENE